MNVLGIDTTTGVLGIILGKGDETVSVSASSGLAHGENLFPWLEQILEKAALEPKDLELIVCALGPGSFTGLRIGLAAAKGLALSTSCALTGVPSLDVYGARYAFFPGVVVPVIDARKGRFYAAVYEKGRRTGDYLDIPPDDLRTLAAGREHVFLTGPDAHKIYDASASVPRPTHITVFPSAQELPTLLELGMKTFRESGPLPDGAGPLYIRPSEAEAKRTENQGK